MTPAHILKSELTACPQSEERRLWKFELPLAPNAGVLGLVGCWPTLKAQRSAVEKAPRTFSQSLGRRRASTLITLLDCNSEYGTTTLAQLSVRRMEENPASSKSRSVRPSTRKSHKWPSRNRKTPQKPWNPYVAQTGIESSTYPIPRVAKRCEELAAAIEA